MRLGSGLGLRVGGAWVRLLEIRTTRGLECCQTTPPKSVASFFLLPLHTSAYHYWGSPFLINVCQFTSSPHHHPTPVTFGLPHTVICELGCFKCTTTFGRLGQCACLYVALMGQAKWREAGRDLKEELAALM